jgi:undecaprenyl-diphosphatase
MAMQDHNSTTFAVFSPEWFSHRFGRLDRREIGLVHRAVGTMHLKPMRFIALAVNHLGNGYLYPIIAVVVLAWFGWAMLPAVLIATATTFIAHLIYPLIKRKCGRARPIDTAPGMQSLLRPLDPHSFPSGHAMTATAALVPLSIGAPIFTPIAVLIIAVIGWGRMAAGHHYLSDIAAGIVLGGALAIPGLWWLLS